MSPYAKALKVERDTVLKLLREDPFSTKGYIRDAAGRSTFNSYSERKPAGTELILEPSEADEFDILLIKTLLLLTKKEHDG